MKIGFIGLGAMGTVMARNLVASGHDVFAWKRSGGQMEGVTMVDTSAALFDADAVITMLPDDAAIRSVVLDERLLQVAKPGLVHIVMSTISVAFAHELDAVHKAAGVDFVSAPVLGRPEVAAKGELNILAGGDAAAIAKVQMILDVLGKRIWDMGSEAPAANAAKIACNMMISMTIEALAEAVVLTEANGLQRTDFFDLILGTLFGGRSYQVYSAIIAEGNYDPGFRAKLGLKDLRLAREAAADAGRALPMLDAVHERMREAVDAGLGDRDWSAMAKFTIENR